MTQLGCFDPGVSDPACKAHLKEVEALTRVPLAEVRARLPASTA